MSDNKNKRNRTISKLYEDNNKIKQEKPKMKIDESKNIGLDLIDNKIRYLKPRKKLKPNEIESLEWENIDPVKFFKNNKYQDFILKYNSFLYIINRDIYLSEGTEIDDAKFYALMAPYMGFIKYSKNKQIETNFQIYKAMYYLIKYKIKNDYNKEIDLNKFDDDMKKLYNSKILRINYLDFLNVFRTYFLLSNIGASRKYNNFFDEIDRQFIVLYDNLKRLEFDLSFIENLNEVLKLENDENIDKSKIKIRNYNNINIKNELIEYYKNYKYPPRLIEYQNDIYVDSLKLYKTKNNNINFDITQVFCKDLLQTKLSRKTKIRPRQFHIFAYLINNYDCFKFKYNKNGFALMKIYNFMILNEYTKSYYNELTLDYNYLFNNMNDIKYRFSEKLCVQNFYLSDFSKTIINNKKNKYETGLHFSNWSYITYYDIGINYIRVKYDVYKKRYNMLLDATNNENESFKYYIKIGNIDNINFIYNNNIETFKKEVTDNNKTIIIRNNNTIINFYPFIKLTLKKYIDFENNKNLLIMHRTDNFLLFGLKYKCIRNFQKQRTESECIIKIFDEKFLKSDDSIENRILYWNKTNKLSNINFYIPGYIYDPYLILLYNYKRDKLLEKKECNLLNNGYLGYKGVNSINYKINSFPVEIKDEIDDTNFRLLNNNNIIIYTENNEFNIVNKLKILELIPNDCKDYIDLDVKKESKYYLSYCLKEYLPIDLEYYVLLYNYNSLSNDFYNYSPFKYKYYKYLKKNENFEKIIENYENNLLNIKEEDNVLYIYHKERNIFINNMLIINLIYFKGVNNLWIDNISKIPQNSYDLFRIEFNIIMNECNIYKKYNELEELNFKWNENIELRENFQYYYEKYEIYYKFLEHYILDKKNFIKKIIIEYLKLKSLKNDLLNNIEEELQKFNEDDFEFLRFDLNDLYDKKVCPDTEQFHKNIILNIKKILKSKKFKKLYNTFFGYYPYRDINSIEHYFFYKNYKNYNLKSYKDIKNIIKKYSLYEKKKLFGSYQSYIIKNYYLKQHYKYNIQKKFSDVILNFAETNNYEIIYLVHNNLYQIFNKPKKPKLSINLFFYKLLKDNDLHIYNESDAFSIISKSIKIYKERKEEFKKLEKSFFDKYLMDLNNYEQYGYYITQKDDFI